MTRPVSRSDYEALSELRYRLRLFLNFSDDAARSAGLEPHQHQLLLAIKGLVRGVRPTVGVIAERLQIRHHSAVELASRCERAGLIERRPSATDRREVVLHITEEGESVLRALSVAHRKELREQGPTLTRALNQLLRGTKEQPAGTTHESSRS